MFGISVIANQAKGLLKLTLLSTKLYEENQHLSQMVHNLKDNNQVYMSQNEKCIVEIRDLKGLVKQHEEEYGDALKTERNLRLDIGVYQDEISKLKQRKQNLKLTIADLEADLVRTRNKNNELVNLLRANGIKVG